MSADIDEVVLLLQREQRGLLGFLLALTGDREAADDLFQATCLEIWRIREDYQSGTNFGAWARAVARIQVLRHLRSRSKDRQVPFSPEVIEHLAEEWDSGTDREEDASLRQSALRKCINELEPEQWTVLRRRYTDGWSHAKIAADAGRSEDGIKMIIMRLRRKLQECVERKLSQETP